MTYLTPVPRFDLVGRPAIGNSAYEKFLRAVSTAIKAFQFWRARPSPGFKMPRKYVSFEY